MSYLSFLSKEFKLYLDTLKSDLKNRQNKDFFAPFGTQVHCGRQGSGKTISAVHVLNRLKARYPKAIVVSNLSLSGYRAISTAEWLCYNAPNQTEQATWPVSDQPAEAIISGKLDPVKDYVHFTSPDELHIALTNINNGFYGVIYLIDEIHIYFNSLDSKNTPIYIFGEISQQRKQRKLVIGTSQLFTRLSKPFREQCDNLIMCNTIAGVLTTMKAYDGKTLEQTYDGHIIGTKRSSGFFFHSIKDRNSYDTYQKVIGDVLDLENSPYLNKKQYKEINKR